MSHELFIDLTQEQQEIVAGGTSALNVQTYFESLYKQFESIGPVVSNSGPGGSTVASGGIYKSIEAIIKSGSSFTGYVS